MERSSDWLDQARGDLARAREDVEAGFFEWACHAAQQGAEKAVKAALQKLGADDGGRTVAFLLDAVAAVREVPPALRAHARALDEADTPVRYLARSEGSPYGPDAGAEAERLIGYAEHVLAFSEGIVSEL